MRSFHGTEGAETAICAFESPLMLLRIAHLLPYVLPNVHLVGREALLRHACFGYHALGYIDCHQVIFLGQSVAHALSGSERTIGCYFPVPTIGTTRTGS